MKSMLLSYSQLTAISVFIFFKKSKVFLDLKDYEPFNLTVLIFNYS